MSTKNKQAAQAETPPTYTAAPHIYHAYTWAVGDPTKKDSWEWSNLAEDLEQAAAVCPVRSTEHRVLARAAADCRKRAGL